MWVDGARGMVIEEQLSHRRHTVTKGGRKKWYREEREGGGDKYPMPGASAPSRELWY